MKCLEIDGPPVAWFCDGKDMVKYSTIRLKTQYPQTSETLLLALEERFQRIRERSTVIVWRLRPSLKFIFKAKDGGEFESDLPEISDYENNLAHVRIRCRLACYPPLTESESAEFGVVGEGMETPTL